MSHFTCLVRVPGETPLEEVEVVLEELLAPFDENSKDPKYTEFRDTEEEGRHEYETETEPRVTMLDGSWRYPWDELFRVPGTFGTGANTHKIPPHLKEVDIPHKDIYPTFEAFMKDWKSQERDSQGRYGYTENPNAKWDWFEVGGRWRRSFPVKDGAQRIVAPIDEKEYLFHKYLFHKGPRPTWPPNMADGCRIKDIDLEALAKETLKKLDEYWEKWLIVKELGEIEGMEGFYARSTAIKAGLLQSFDAALITEKERDMCTAAYFRNMAIPVEWSPVSNPVIKRIDLRSTITKDAYYVKCADYFNPIRPYCYLDSEHGWVAPGTMGWWGVSDDTLDSKSQHTQSFYAWLNEGSNQDWVVTVDCHI